MRFGAELFAISAASNRSARTSIDDNRITTTTTTINLGRNGVIEAVAIHR